MVLCSKTEEYIKYQITIVCNRSRIAGFTSSKCVEIDIRFRVTVKQSHKQE